MDFLSDGALAGLCGAGGGALLGLAARLGRFCGLGAIEDATLAADYRRLRMWALALAVAIAGTRLVAELGVVELAGSTYLKLSWNPVASIVGGLMFGYGMALVGACGYGALARLGGGDLRGLVIVLVMGVSAYVASSGILSGLRLSLFPVERIAPGAQPPGLTELLSAETPLPTWTASAVIAAALAVWALRSAAFRRSTASWFWAAMVGLAIVSGWAATGWLAAHSFEPVEPASHTYTGPLGETLIYAMTSDGSAPSFAVGSVLGVVLGALLAALWKSEFRWEACDDARELRRQILGAVLMGVGGVVAMGCTVGQGLSAFSVLALSAPVALASIAAGAWLGLNQLVLGLHRAFR